MAIVRNSTSVADKRAVLFDLDGTLVRTFIDFPAMRRAMQALSTRYGTGEATQDEEDILEIVRTMADTIGGTAGEQARRAAYAELEAWEQAGCANPEVIPGASELLRRLRGECGVSVGIITRNSRAIAEDLLARMELEADTLVAREDVPEFKPHPAPVLYACRRLAVDTVNAVMVGDFWTDIAAGRAAGVGYTIGVQWPHDPPGRFVRCPPDYQVSSFGEVAALLL